MKKELQERLFQRHSKLFRQRELSKREPIMSRGIEVEGDGWYWLLDKLCECIQECIDRNRLEQIEFTQVKEKLSKLCIYTNYDNEKINGMIWLAGHLSGYICERCGAAGNVTRLEGLIKALCGNCKTDIENERKSLY
jgi:hypothetical protein